jgi:hypothetical protein
MVNLTHPLKLILNNFQISRLGRTDHSSVRALPSKQSLIKVTRTREKALGKCVNVNRYLHPFRDERVGTELSASFLFAEQSEQLLGEKFHIFFSQLFFQHLVFQMRGYKNLRPVRYRTIKWVPPLLAFKRWTINHGKLERIHTLACRLRIF